MTWDFLHRYRVRHADSGSIWNPTPDPADEVEPSVENGGADGVHVDLAYEEIPEAWAARPVKVPAGWSPATWSQRPRYFLDGKEVGETVEWLRAPGGYHVPVRVAQIGAALICIEDGVPRRKDALVEQVVALPIDPFPWDEVEDFAATLAQYGFRLLPTRQPEPEELFDPQLMWRATKNRTTTEMGILEETLLGAVSDQPTVIDGRLEPRTGGLDQRASPATGVVKTHHRTYLHRDGLRVLQGLAPGERTPLFAIHNPRFPVVSWYLRLSGVPHMAPDYAVVRAEVPVRWFETMVKSERLSYVARLSQLLIEYRSQSSTYGRAPISLHPIVRAEELLSALFRPWAMLAQHFYRLSGL